MRRLEFVGVRGVLGDNQHERLDQRLQVLAGIDVELDLGVFVDANAILQLQLFQPGFIVVLCTEVLAGGDGGFLHETIPERRGQRVAVDDVLEVSATAPFQSAA